MGTALQNMLLGLQPHTKAAASLMRDLGISAKDGAADSFYQLDGTLKPLPDIIGILNDKFGGLNDRQKEAALATTFTKYGLAGLNTIVTESKDKFNEFKDSLMQENAADIAKEKMNNLQGDMWKVQAAVSTLSKSFGNTLEPAMRSIAQATLSVVQWFNNLSPSTKQTIMVIGGIASAMVTVGGAILTFVSTLGFLKMGLKGLELSFTEVLSPVGLVVGVIALLGVSAYELYTHWGQVKAATQELRDKLVALKSEAVDALKKAWDDMKQAVQAVESKFTDFKQNAIDTVQNAIKNLTDAYNSHKTAINAVATALGIFFGPALIKVGVQAGVTGAQLAGQFIVNVVKTGTEAVIAGGKMTAQFIASITKAGAEAVIAGGKMSVQLIANIVKAGAEAVVASGKITLSLITAILDLGMNAAITGAKMTGQLITAVVSFGLEGWKTAASVGAQTVALVANAAAIVAQKAALAASTIATGAMTAAQWALNVAMDANPIGLVILAIGALIAIGYEMYKHWDELKAKAIELWHTIENNPILALIAGPIGALIAAGIEVYKNWDTIKQKAVELWQGITSVFNDIKTYVTGLWNEAEQWGSRLIDMFTQGVRQKASEVGDAIKGVADTIVHWLGFHSPSAGLPDSDQYAPNFVNMFANGLLQGVPQVANAANALAAPLQKTLGSNITDPKQFVMVQDSIRGIITAKETWTKASQAGDQKAMDSAHAMAEKWREELTKMGVDASVFGADKTLPDTMANLKTLTANATDAIKQSSLAMQTGVSTDFSTMSGNASEATQSILSNLQSLRSSMGSFSIFGNTTTTPSTDSSSTSNLSQQQIDQVKVAGNKIIEAKMKWAEASKLGDQAMMDASHKMADDYRAQLTAMGVDTTQFAADKSIQQAMIARDQITSQAIKQLNQNYDLATTSMMSNNNDYLTNTTKSTQSMSTQWQSMSTNITSTAVKMAATLKEAFTAITGQIQSSSVAMEDSMMKAFVAIAESAQRAAQQVVTAVNQMRAAMASVGITPHAVSVSPISMPGGASAIGGGVNNNYHQGAIQISINGTNKDGKQVADEIMRQLRQKVQYAL